jgi:hypothetical protein
MKATVYRQLSGGLYYVSFKVGDFTDDDRKKMESFGIPLLKIKSYSPQHKQNIPINQPLTNIAESLKGAFTSEDEAKKYEVEVMRQIREAATSLRERKDAFTGTDEVDI